jgi:hypothetical protein
MAGNAHRSVKRETAGASPLATLSTKSPRWTFSGVWLSSSISTDMAMPLAP